MRCKNAIREMANNNHYEQFRARSMNESRTFRREEEEYNKKQNSRRR